MKCSICGEELKSYEKDVCFECNLWAKRLKEVNPVHKVAIIDGTYYFIGDEDSTDFFRGFGGARFQIEFNDGHRVVTTNLWCGGEISPAWRDKLPNNARFENNLKWKKIGECKYLVCE